MLEKRIKVSVNTSIENSVPRVFAYNFLSSRPYQNVIKLALLNESERFFCHSFDKFVDELALLLVVQVSLQQDAQGPQVNSNVALWDLKTQTWQPMGAVGESRIELSPVPMAPNLRY